MCMASWPQRSARPGSRSESCVLHPARMAALRAGCLYIWRRAAIGRWDPRQRKRCAMHDVSTIDPRDLDSVEELQAYCDDQAAAILEWCRERDVKIACAESLTGGLLADAFVRIPGASQVFLGSAVTYDIHAKASVLGVNAELLRREGAVHPQVAIEMAQRTAQLFSQSEYRSRIIGLSTTGVAGPGADGGKPAGLVYIGVSFPEIPAVSMESSRYAVELNLQGSREVIRHKTIGCVLENLREFSGSSQE